MGAFGQYIYGTSIIHRLDGRNKLLLMILFLVAVFMTNNFWVLLVLLLISIFFIVLSKINLKYFYNTVRFFILMVAITAIFQIIFSRGGHVYFKVVFFEVTSLGLHLASLAFIRFLIAIMVTNLYFMTTPPIQIADSISGILKPFKIIKLPVEDISLVLSIAFRFVPTMTIEFQNIIDAQKSRGVSFTTGPIMKRIKSFVPIIVPLFLNTFRRAEDLASAMLMRRYTDGKNVTRMREMKWKTIDSFALILVIFISISSVLISKML